MAAVAVVMAPFFAAIIIATRQAVGASSPGDVILMSLVGLRQTRFGEIIDCSEKRCCMVGSDCSMRSDERVESCM